MVVLVALLPSLDMLLVGAAARAAGGLLIVRAGCLLRVIVAILVALLASLDVLFVRSTLISHSLSPWVS